MSRTGKLPITVTSDVNLNINGRDISVKGPKGELSYRMPKVCKLEKKENEYYVIPMDKSKRARSLWGTSRSLIQNMIDGVSKGFTKKLELVGVGYRAQMRGKDLVLQLGFSHEVVYSPAENIEIKAPKQNEIEIHGVDKQKVGQTAAEIRAYRPPEPYKGKGVKYADEYIFRKEGKRK